jgi:DNA transformation protein
MGTDETFRTINTVAMQGKPKDPFVDYLLEQMALVGSVQARKMFGGYGLYLDGCMFAIVVDGELYFKTDAASRPAYIAEQLPPFSYRRQGKPVTLAFHQAPPAVFDDPETMRHWAGQAYRVARTAKMGSG